jgi:hypothetical protein
MSIRAFAFSTMSVDAAPLWWDQRLLFALCAKGKATMKNVGREDRIIRIVVGLVLALLAYLNVLPGAGTIVLWVLAAYLLITGLLARCLVYKLADIDTSIQEQPYSSTDDRSGL